MLDLFVVSVNTIAMSFSVTGGSASQLGSVVGDSCITDWLTIPCATNTNNPLAQTSAPTICVDRICGMVFNSVTASANTISVPVNSMFPLQFYIFLKVSIDNTWHLFFKHKVF